MQTIPQFLTSLVYQAVVQTELTDVLDAFPDVRATKNPKFGDFQSNHAFDIGRKMRTNPRDIAKRVMEQLPQHPAIEKVDIAGPGFLNFHMRDTWLCERLRKMMEEPQRGIIQSGNNQTVVIDYSSPNVAKRMHIGHMRSTIIGNALDRLYRASGWRVIADNHIGDWGTQFGKLIVAWNRMADEKAFEEDPIGELERLYVHFSQNATEEDLEQARMETAKLQAGDPTNRQLWSTFIEESMKEFEKVYQRLGIRFDETLGESAYNDALPEVVSSLKACGLSTDSEGASIIRFPEDADPKSIANTVLVVQKQDGAFLYGTTDLATLEYRKKTWSPNRIIYVTDTRQQLHFRQVFHIWNRWRTLRGEEDIAKPALIHTWFGMLKLPEGAMSSRKGNVIRLIDLMDESVRRARMVTDAKSGHLSEDERKNIAEAVGLAAIRYSDLAQNPQTDVQFTWDKVLSLEGNTAPFLMYSYARGRGIQRKSGRAEHSIDSLMIHAPIERELVLLLLKFPVVVEMSQQNCKPNLLCDYLYMIADCFNRFYNLCPVLSAESEPIKNARLSLVECTLCILEKGLSLLGIEALDRM